MSAQIDTNETEWTLARLLAWTTEYLTRQGIADARLASEVLLAHAIGRRRIDLYARFDTVPDGPSIARFRTLVQRAATHEPIAYLVGEKEFFSLPFIVTRDVLIPRPETETLVEVVLDHCRTAKLTSPRMLDVGTGSGCIAMALLKQIAGATVVATDVSAAALAVARRNAERHNVAGRFAAVKADRFVLPVKVLAGGKFDVIVSNPPYIAAEEVRELDANVRDFEPHVALTDGEDGLGFYRSMRVDAKPLLAPEGVIVVEVADGQARRVIETMCEGDAFALRGSRNDRVVGTERVLVFSCP